jgi:bifunctional non-homologous end joining protein LigD
MPIDPNNDPNEAYEIIPAVDPPGYVQFYAFDMPALDGDDIRKLPLLMRKANLARLLARRVDGIFLSDFEQGDICPDLFRAACRMGLEGLVSKLHPKLLPSPRGRADRDEVKNRSHPAIEREL